MNSWFTVMDEKFIVVLIVFTWTRISGIPLIITVASLAGNHNTIGINFCWTPHPVQASHVLVIDAAVQPTAVYCQLEWEVARLAGVVSVYCGKRPGFADVGKRTLANVWQFVANESGGSKIHGSFCRVQVRAWSFPNQTLGVSHQPWGDLTAISIPKCYSASVTSCFNSQDCLLCSNKRQDGGDVTHVVVVHRVEEGGSPSVEGLQGSCTPRLIEPSSLGKASILCLLHA